MSGEPKRDGSPGEIKENRQEVINIINVNTDKKGKATKMDIYQEAHRRGIAPTDTEEILQLLRRSDGIMETSDGKILLTYQ